MARKNRDIEQEVLEDMEHPSPSSLHVDFDSFWLDIKNKNSLRDSVKESLREYFKGLGILGKPSEYSKAARDFGLRV